ncbi:MAG: hypothetical protein ACREN8_05340, partial [Candidatus Dormibacteraceae bacterium]
MGELITAKMGQLGGVHLAGSIPLASAAEVFLTLATELGDRISRMPDGETGNRALFILWQGEQAFARNPAFQQVRGILKPRAFRPYELRAGVDPTQISFPPLGYAEAALSSYAVFRQLKDEGVIPPGIRFQVSLPTPLNILSMVISRRDMGQVEATYEAALLAEVDQIIKAIPSQELAIQWDAPYEVRVWMDRVPLFMSSPWFENQREYVLRTLTRLGEHIPVPVELGYHLCYGDYSNTDNLFFMLMGIPKSKLIRRLGGGLLNRLARRFLGPPSDATAVTEISSG